MPALVLLVAFCAACATETRPPNVVVIVLDTVRPDYLSVYGHPRPTSPYLEEFAAGGVLFERAYSSSSWTLPAHATLFSGLLPTDHGATQTHTRVVGGIPLLAERLAQAGYRTAAFSANPWVSSTTGLDRGFQRFYEGWNHRQSAPQSIDEHPILAAVSGWLDENREAEEPAFVFVNLIEPHLPYTPSWSAARPFFSHRRQWASAVSELFPQDDANRVQNRHYERSRPLTAEEWGRLRALYEGELLTTDHLVRRIMETVEASCDDANTAVFLLSDHGESLGEHDHLGHEFNLYESTLRIALLARGPGFEPGTVQAAPAHIADVHATILGLAGLEDGRGYGLDLRSALPMDRTLAASLDFPEVSLSRFPATLRANAETLERHRRSLWTAVGPRFKAIGSSDGSLELFDLELDPGEARRLPEEAVSADLVEALESARPRSTRSGVLELSVKNQRGLDALRSLGYIR